MEISASRTDENLTKVVITVELFGDKQYAELLYRTIDDNIPKKTDIKPTTTDDIRKTTTIDK